MHVPDFSRSLRLCVAQNICAVRKRGAMFLSPRSRRKYFTARKNTAPAPFAAVRKR